MIFFFHRCTPFVLLVVAGVFWRIKSETFRLRWLAACSWTAVAGVHPLFAGLVAVFLWLSHLALKQTYGATKKRGRLGWVLGACLCFLLVAKYGGSFVQRIFPGDDWMARHWILPLGVSYFIFRLLQYVLDFRRGLIRDPSFESLFLFIFFLPTFPAGPLESFQHFYEHRARTWEAALFKIAFRKMAIGYFQKLLVVDMLFASLLGNSVAKFATANVLPRASRWELLGFVAGSLLRAYFDLAAYSNIAIGMSALFGFRIMENFNAPFFKTNLAEFWRSWHVSLSQWCRNQIYFPVLGWTRRVELATYASMLGMGLWHYFSFNWTVWAIYHATGLIMVHRWTRFLRKKENWQAWLATGPARFISTVLTFVYVALGFSFVAVSNFRVAVQVFLGCLGFRFV